MLHCNITASAGFSAVPIHSTPGDLPMLTPEQIMASHKANVETLFGLTSKAFEGVEKLVELNVSAAKAALNDSASRSIVVFSVRSE